MARPYLKNPSSEGIFTIRPGLGEDDEASSNPSGCTYDPTVKDGLEKYRQCQDNYWGASAGDCNKFRKWAESNTAVDKENCIKAGGSGDEPCLELAHSCASTVVCQVFNYIYGQGQFTQECGRYGAPVGDAIWYLSGFAHATSLGKWLLESIKCIGANTGSCWNNFESVRGAYHNAINDILFQLTNTWDKQRESLGLPPSAPCIDVPFVSIAAMLARGKIPDSASPSTKQTIINSILNAANYKPSVWSQTCQPNQFPCCKTGSLDLESAIVELSLWADANGFGKAVESSKLTFLNGSNWVQAGSWAIASSLELVKEPKVMALNSISLAPKLPVPQMLPPGSNPVRLMPPAGAHSAEWSSEGPNRAAFNIYRLQKGGPEKCKSIAATEDSKTCAIAAQQVYQARLDSVYRVLPLVVGAMSAHNIQYAMLKQQATSPIPVPNFQSTLTAKKKDSLNLSKVETAPIVNLTLNAKNIALIAAAAIATALAVRYALKKR